MPQRNLLEFLPNHIPFQKESLQPHLLFLHPLILFLLGLTYSNQESVIFNRECYFFIREWHLLF